MNRPKSLCFRRACFALVVLASGGTLSGAGALAQGNPGVTVEELQSALAERDAIIIDLLNRVRSLERDRNISQGQARPARPAAEMSAAIAARPEDTPAGGESAIDELAAERALERGLVQEGARLLAPGQIDLSPAFTLTRSNTMYPAALASDEASFVGEVSETYDISERRTDIRVGLPWDSQLEIGLPYVHVEQEIETTINGGIRSVTDQSGAGFADATIGFSRVLASERGARPNLIGRLLWLTGSGDEQDGPVALGGGQSGFGGRLSAHWRRDPVVFLLSGGYTRFDADGILTRGDSIDLSLGLGLALSPDTAMVFTVNNTLADELKRNGVAVAGTDRLTSTLDFSVSTTLGRRLFLRGYTAAGLTDDSPDYRFGISLSARFDPR